MNNTVVNEIKGKAIYTKFAGSNYLSISDKNVKAIADTFNIEKKTVEITAIENNIVPKRYIRNMRTLTFNEQAKLLKSSVSIVGLGGLGGTVSEIFARIGIGNINLIDGDKFEESNLNRQILSVEKSLKIPKVLVAAKRIKAINSSISIKQYEKFLTEKNATKLIGNSEVVVDCLDNLKTRFLLEESCKENNVPLVSAAVAGVLGQVTTIFPEDSGFELIFGKKKTVKLEGAEAYLGCLPFTVTMIASIECSEVIKIFLDKGSLLRNKLLVADLMDNTIEVFNL
mmetsp:Transcript_3561/g.2145  ORF Transcript_3561/g.2145 Transcript_3561/m.2145 type:complete len:284 (+) Transcript_3561:135-986(+)